MGIQTNVNSANRLIILHVGGIKGLIPKAELVYRAWSATRDYYGQMNSQKVDNLPPQLVTVLDKTPYHCLQTDKHHHPMQ
jgi:hypothetical protein